MQTRKALKRLSKGEIKYDRVTSDGPLAQNADWLVDAHKRNNERIASEQKRHEFAASLPILQAARAKLEQALGQQILPDDAPIVTRFDAHSLVKVASKELTGDYGLRRLSLHLERLWHKEPLGALTAGVVSRLRDHYQHEYPTSKVAHVIDTVIPKVSFNNLPVAKMARIASQISSQDDYDTAIERHGLSGDSLQNVRARTLIRELVNRKLNIRVASSEQQQEPIAQDGQMGGVNSRVTGSDIAARVAARIQKSARNIMPESDLTADSDVESDSDAEAAGRIPSKDLGVEGTGMLPIASKGAVLSENQKMMKAIAAENVELHKVAVAPSGWENTVKEMKGKEDIKDPYALAWWMKEKGYAPGGKKTAQSPHGQGWGAENLAELANDAIGEVNNPEVAQIVNDIVGEYSGQDPGALAGSDLGEALVYGLQANPAMADRLKEVMYKMIMSETPEEWSVSADKKKKKDKGSGQSEFTPEINAQQPSQENIKPGDGAKVLKAFAVPADHPLVDDNKNHVNISTAARRNIAASQLPGIEVPNWWLGSKQELINVVEASIALQKESGKLPPALEKYKKTKGGGDGDKKDKNDDDKGDKGSSGGGMPSDIKDKFDKKKKSFKDPIDKAAFIGTTKENIEEALTKSGSYRAGGHAIYLAQHTAEGYDAIHVGMKTGGKKAYPFYEMDDAIADFMLLVGTEKHPAGLAPSPMFFVREGIRMICPVCGDTNSYQMPKQASDLTCANCDIVVPVGAVVIAMNGVDDNGVENDFSIQPSKFDLVRNDQVIGSVIAMPTGELVAVKDTGEKRADFASLGDALNWIRNVERKGFICEETTLVAVAPISMQKEFGDKFTKAAEMMGADDVGAAGSRAEAYATNVPIEKMADVWDFMIEAGFKSAQMQPPPPSGGAPQGGEPSMDLGSDMPPLPGPPDGPGLDEPPMEGEDPEDEMAMLPDAEINKIISAAMTHYHAQNMNPVSAVVQFSKDYGDEYSPESVIQTVADVWGMPLDQIKVAIKKIADLPATQVNQQQPDAESVEKTVLGPDSETTGDLPSTSVKPQVPAQSQQGTSQADQSTSPDSDNNDPGSFGAPKPKAQHPASDQGGTSATDGNLGPHSDTQMGGIMNKMDSESSGAYSNVRSAEISMEDIAAG